MRTCYSNLSSIQKKAYNLIQADARFFYSFFHLLSNKNLSSNYVMMSLPYLGMFADGAEKWGGKVRIGTVKFNNIEKIHYENMRSSIKYFKLNFNEYNKMLYKAFTENENYFFKQRSIYQKIIKQYNNVGTDIIENRFCGNTILCYAYSPNFQFSDEYKIFMKNVSIVVGKLIAQFGSASLPPYNISIDLKYKYKDYHFFNKCPLKGNNFINFVLFSVLCSINYVLLFVDKCFLDEFPSKLRFAYILYYYLVPFVNEINIEISTSFSINDTYYNDVFRNCMAHYGLGQVMKDSDIHEEDIMMFGLTDKIFSMSYKHFKNKIYNALNELASQLEKHLF